MTSWLATMVAIPWLQGFDPIEVSDHELAVTADIAPSPGEEAITADFEQGIVVYDRNHDPIAAAPGFPSRGSADELIAIAVGDASIGVPVIAVAAATGGHAENITWLTMYRLGDGNQLVPVFTGLVERHSLHTTRTGVIVLFPGGLIYRSPTGGAELWLYDRDRGRYVEQLALGKWV
jgi:hypothetical protein